MKRILAVALCLAGCHEGAGSANDIAADAALESGTDAMADAALADAALADGALADGAITDATPIEVMPTETCGGQAVYALDDPALRTELGEYVLPAARPSGARYTDPCGSDAPDSASGPEVVARFTAPFSEAYVVTATGPSVAHLTVFSTCDPETHGQCASDPHFEQPDFFGFPRSVVVGMAAGDTFYAVVDTMLGGPEGPVRIAVNMPVDLGERCGELDAAYIRCRVGTECGDGRCILPTPPQIDTAEVWMEDDGIHLAVAGHDPRGDARAASIRLIDAQGNRAPERAVDVTTATLATEGTHFRLTGLASVWGLEGIAAVEVFVVDSRGTPSAPVDVVPTRLPRLRSGQACDPQRIVNRCEAGSFCTLDVDRTGRSCHPWTARAWRHGARVAVRVESPTTHVWDGPQVAVEGQLYRGGVDTQVPFESWGSLVLAEKPVGDTIAVGFNRLSGTGDEDAAAIPIESPTPRALGEACDLDRVADLCPVGAACRAGTCVEVAPPVVERARGFSSPYRAGRYGLELAGHQGAAAPTHLVAELLDEAGATVWAWGPLDLGQAEVVWAGPAFHLKWLPFLPQTGGVALRVWLMDAEGTRSAPVEVELEAPDRVARGEACDVEGIFAICPADSVCAPADEHLVCRPQIADCPGDWPVADLTPGTRQATLSGPHDHTDICAAARSAPQRATPEDIYRFTAPHAGTWRFAVQGPPQGTFMAAVRRFCADDSAGSEIACANEYSWDAGSSAASARLDAGDLVFVFVEPLLGDGGEYTLTVEGD